MDKNGRPWTHLCISHRRRLALAIESGDAKQILGAWAKAHGTAERFARRMGV